MSTTERGEIFTLATLDSPIDPLKLCSFSPTIRLKHDNIDDLLEHSKCSTSSCVYTCRPLITGKIPHHRQNARIDSKHSRYDENIFSLMAMLLISLWKVYRKYGCGAVVDSRVRDRRYWQFKHALLHHSISPDPGCLRISGITIVWWWTSRSRRSGKISCVMEIKHQALSGTLFFKMTTHVRESHPTWQIECVWSQKWCC